MYTERVRLPSPSPGTHRELVVHRFGRPGGRKAYLQAALHADELPGVLVLDHLCRRLADADVTGEVVVVPTANPIGLSQSVGGSLLGRYELDGLLNFNRGYADVVDEVARAVADRLGPDSARNVAVIREALVAAVSARPATSEPDALRRELLVRAVDADVVLDLHCDFDAAVHLYTGNALWPDLADLAGWLGAEAVLLADVSGGHPFDEAAGGPWWALARRFPELPIPPACAAATVELRGEDDVDDALAARDADALLRFLQRRGLVAGDPGPVPALRCEAGPFDGVEMLRAPTAGLLVWRGPVGARVRAGEVVAELVDPHAAIGAPRTSIASRVDGVLYGRVRQHLARPGQIVGKVAGASSLAWRTGHLLTD